MVRVDVHAAPWNPADLNAVQGRYPDADPMTRRYRKSLCFPDFTVAGSGGIGRVAEVVQRAQDVEDPVCDPEEFEDETALSLDVGDWVTFARPGMGTMRSTMWLPGNAALKLKRGNDLFGDGGNIVAAAQASTLFQLGGTAIRLLRDFVDSEEGACSESDNESRTRFIVLQNAGNSAVGFMISQLAKILYPKRTAMVSLVRRRSTPLQTDQMVEHLTTEGKNDLVVFEEDYLGEDKDKNHDAVRELKGRFRDISELPPVVAYNAVGGASSDLLLGLLGPEGTHVTYGGMAKQPVTVSTSQLIFKDVRVRGYWHSRWMVRSSLREQSRMLNELVDLVLMGDDVDGDGSERLRCPPVEVFRLCEFKQALECDWEQSNKAIRSKIVFDCRE